MLGRNSFTAAEIAAARADVAGQLATFRAVPPGPERDALEPRFASAVLLALDRRFVHRTRGLAGKKGTPLNELELVAEGLMGAGQLPGSTVVRYDAATAVLGLAVGAEIAPSADDVDALAAAVFAELEETSAG